ncbi:MAG: PEP-CTERM sorting domain-containing protein [Pirellulales bacterium]|nr:PEP-CTERM sorting domain-containing protein [Pirellulales bacterium]
MVAGSAGGTDYALDGGNEEVNYADLNLLLSNYGMEVTGGVAGVHVPEPTSLTLLIAGAAALLWRRQTASFLSASRRRRT